MISDDDPLGSVEGIAPAVTAELATALVIACRSSPLQTLKSGARSSPSATAERTTSNAAASSTRDEAMAPTKGSRKALKSSGDAMPAAAAAYAPIGGHFPAHTPCFIQQDLILTARRVAEQFALINEVALSHPSFRFFAQCPATTARIASSLSWEPCHPVQS